MNFESLEARLAGSRPATIAVCGADGEEVYEAIKLAQAKGLARFLLVGDADRCASLAREHGVEPAGIIATTGADSQTADAAAAAAAVQAVIDGRADLLMKGMVATPVLLKAVVSEKRLFEEGRLLSHVLVVEMPEGRLLGITDGGMNPQPDFAQKATIIRNAVDLFHTLGVPEPKVALLAANEKPNPKIPGSQDAVDLKAMASGTSAAGNGADAMAGSQFQGCIIDGPLALDLALSPRAADIKGYKGSIRGNADILLVHDISAGNHLGKAIINLAGYPGGGMIVGAKVPIILLSRSDTASEKYNSVVLALAGSAGVIPPGTTAGKTTGGGR